MAVGGNPARGEEEGAAGCGAPANRAAGPARGATAPWREARRPAARDRAWRARAARGARGAEMSRSAALLLCLLGCHVWKAVTKTLREPGAGAQGRWAVAEPGGSFCVVPGPGAAAVAAAAGPPTTLWLRPKQLDLHHGPAAPTSRYPGGGAAPGTRWARGADAPLGIWVAPAALAVAWVAAAGDSNAYIRGAFIYA